MTVGRLLGIARRASRGAPMEELAAAFINRDFGVVGDFRGKRKPGSLGKRQVVILLLEDWRAALADIGADLPWTTRRANLLIEHLALPQGKGTRIMLGSALLEITGECDPCSRMDEACQGLRNALEPDWRGGRTATVIEDGQIATGDEVRIQLL